MKTRAITAFLLHNAVLNAVLAHGLRRWNYRSIFELYEPIIYQVSSSSLSVWRSRHSVVADAIWLLTNGFATLYTMRSAESNVRRHKGISFLLAFALSFLAAFNVGLASGLPDLADPVLQGSPIEAGLVSSTHSEHTPNDSSEFCQNPSCKALSDCAVACSMSMGCASSSVLLTTTTPYAQAKSRAYFTEHYASSRYTSRQANSLYRPPIC